MYRNRDGKAIIKRLTDEMDKHGLDALLLKSSGAMTYATGYYIIGAMAEGSMVVLTRDGKLCFIVSEFQKQAVQEVVDDSVCLVSYPCWIYIEDYACENMKKETQPDPFKIFKLAIDCLPSESGLKIGVETDVLNYREYEFLEKAMGRENLIDAKQIIIDAHAVKTPWEIDVLRRNAQATERAMHRVAKDTVPGMTMQDIYQQFSIRCLEECKSTMYVLHAHTLGPKFTPTNVPSHFRLKYGDLVRLDGGCTADSYPADLGRTFAVGGYCSPDKSAIYESLWRGYEFATTHMGPGVKMADLFHGMEKAINLPGYVRGHFGHSLGVMPGENYPFIAPDSDRVFEPGMVFCIETPFYSSAHHTYNIEDTVLVTENGIEMFTNTPHSLYY